MTLPAGTQNSDAGTSEPARLRALVEDYLAALSGHQLEKCLSYFADDAMIEFQSGVFKGPEAIAEWRAMPAAVELALERPSSADRAEYRRLRTKAMRELRAAGLPALIPVLDDSLFMASIQSRVPDDTRETIEQMLDLRQPAAIVVASTDAP